MSPEYRVRLPDKMPESVAEQIKAIGGEVVFVKSTKEERAQAALQVKEMHHDRLSAISSRELTPDQIPLLTSTYSIFLTRLVGREVTITEAQLEGVRKITLEQFLTLEPAKALAIVGRYGLETGRPQLYPELAGRENITKSAARTRVEKGMLVLRHPSRSKAIYKAAEIPLPWLRRRLPTPASGI